MDSIVLLLIEISWQIMIVMGIVWLISRLARKAPAAWRHALWVFVLIKFLIPPIVQLPVPGNITAPQDATLIVRSAIQVVSQSSSVIEAAAGFPSTTMRKHRIAYPAINVIAYLWLLAICIMTVHLGIRYRRQIRFLRSTKPSDNEFDDLLKECAAKLNIRSLPEIRLASGNCSPMLVGFFRPIIVLPESISSMCKHLDINVILLHELGHLKRGDNAICWLIELMQVLFFFHPAMWITKREIRLECERACDEFVLLQTNIQRDEYASGYISALKLASIGCRGVSILAMAEPIDIEKRRLNMILRNAIPKMSGWWIVAFLVVILMVLPTFAGGKMINRDIKESCKANMVSCGKYLMMYADHHDGWLPSDEGQKWVMSAQKYIKSMHVLFCPNDKSSILLLNQIAHESGVDLDQSLILGELEKQNANLTSYELPQMTGGMPIKDLPQDAILLQERGPGHDGKLLQLHLDFKFTEVDIPSE